jgi:hypothetical protein
MSSVVNRYRAKVLDGLILVTGQSGELKDEVECLLAVQVPLMASCLPRDA